MNNKSQHPEKKPFDRAAYNKEYQKAYRKKNSEKNKAYQKQYRKDNAEKRKIKAKEYRQNNQDKIKENRVKNKEKTKAYNKQYRELQKLKKPKKKQDPNKKPFDKKEYQKQYAIKNADKLKQKQKEYRIKNKEKLQESRKKVYAKNSEHYKQYHKNYRNNNKEKCILRDKQYRVNNKEKLKHCKRNYVSKKRKTDPLFKLVENLRSRVNSALKNQDSKKFKQTLDLIGCTPEFLYEYLESKFADGMSWNNYGKFGWHMDHIIPCASFDLNNEAEQKKCFHYSNLQPLWWIDNIKKSDKIL